MHHDHSEICIVLFLRKSGLYTNCTVIFLNDLFSIKKDFKNSFNPRNLGLSANYEFLQFRNKHSNTSKLIKYKIFTSTTQMQ